MPISEEVVYTLLINKSKLFGQSLGIYLTEKLPSIYLLGSFENAIQAYELIGMARIDLLILDATLKGEPAQNAVNNFKEFYPKLHVVGLVDNDSLESIKDFCTAEPNAIVYNHLETSDSDLLKAITEQFKYND